MGWLNNHSGVLRNVSNNMIMNLVLNYGLILGCIGGVCMFGAFPLFYYKFGMGAVEFQKYVAIAFLCWSCNTLVGAISDTRPVLGWHKRWYLLLANIVTCGALVGVGFSQTADDALGFLCLVASGVMVNNTLWEGQIANMVSFMRADYRIISFSWGLYMAGLGLGACIVGPLGDETGDNIHKAFFIVSPLAILACIPIVLWPDTTLPGDREGSAVTPTLLSAPGESGEELILVQGNALLKKEWGFIVWLTASSVLLVFVLMYGAEHSSMIAVALSLFIVVVSIVAVIIVHRGNWELCVVCIYSLLHQMFWINIQGALDAFYTANSECFYDGPNFPLWFYYSMVQVISSVVGVVAASLHTGFFSKWDVRSAEINAIVFRIITGLFDLVIVQRWNTRCVSLNPCHHDGLSHPKTLLVPGIDALSVCEIHPHGHKHDVHEGIALEEITLTPGVGHCRYLHINDESFYIMGDAIAGEAATILVMLPLKTLAAKSMPQGRATTSYAMITGLQFLGISVSRIMGIAMTKGLGVRASQTMGCDFTQLPVLISMAHMVFPILSLAVAWGMVPRVKLE